MHSTPFWPSLGFAVVMFMFVITYFTLQRPHERKALLVIAIFSYLLKAILVPIYYMILVEAGLDGFAYIDAAEYHSTAMQMAFEVRHDMPHQNWGWTKLSNGYFILCAYIYAWFGTNTLLPRFLNAAVSTMSLLYVYRIARHYYENDPKIARIAVLLTAFMPFPITTIINQRKDPIAQFFTLMAFYHGSVLLQMDRRWRKSLFFMALSLVPLFYIRTGFIPPFLAIMAIAFIMLRRNIATGLAAGAAVLIVFVGFQMVTPSDSRLNVRTSIERLEGKASSAEVAKKQSFGLLKHALITSPLEIYKFPFTIFLMMVIPFPPSLDFAYVPTLIRSWANLVCLFFYPRMFIGAVAALRDRTKPSKVPILLYTGTILLIIGAVNPSVTRYRETVLPILFILVASGLRKKRSLIVNFVFTGLLCVMAAGIYLARFLRG